MSIDSTKLKAEQHLKDQFPSWVAAFRNFYLTYPEELAKQCSIEGVAAPDLWKCLGDEMVFCTEISTCDQVQHLLGAFRNATINYQKPNSIKLKNAAWLADFPVGNSEVMVREHAARKAGLDFLGPHMDLGFRLTHKASVRRFVISAEVALLILDSVNSLEIYFEGTEILRGVLNDMEYPILWLDMSDKSTLKDRLRGNAPPQHELKTYCIEFLKNSVGQISIPYLPNDKNFSKKPAGWDDRYAKACRLNDAGIEVPIPNTDDGGVMPKKDEVDKVVQAANDALAEVEDNKKA